MPDARFLQIHSLHGYSAVLLNRDDSGLAKRIMYGGASRTRISSQCLKRHWRVAKSQHALQEIDGAAASVRSRETVTRRVIQPLTDAGHDQDVVGAISAAFQTAVYGDKGADRANRQPLLLGEPEIEYLATEARQIAEGHRHDPKAAASAAAAWSKEVQGELEGAARRLCRPGRYCRCVVRSDGHVGCRSEHRRGNPRCPRLHRPFGRKRERLLHGGR